MPREHRRSWLLAAALCGAALVPCAARAALYAEYQMEQATWSGTPNEVQDTSGNGRHGVRVGTAQTTASGKVCRGASIPNNTTSTVYAINTGLDLETTVGNSGTIAFWYKSNVNWNSSNARQLIDAAGTNDTRLFFLQLNTAGELQWLVKDSLGQKAESKTSAFSFTSADWVHIAVTWALSGSSTTLRVYTNATLQKTDTNGSSGTLANLGTLYVGDNGNGIVGEGGTVRSANGTIDEVRIYNNVRTQAEIQSDMNATHACSGGVDHFVIGHDDYGIHCVNETITVSVRDAANNPLTTYNSQVTLDTQTGKGTWALVTGSGTFSDGTANDGIATYTWALGESSATFSLAYSEGAAVFDVDVYQTSVTTIRDDDSEGNITFSQSGFTVTATALSNPPPGTIPAFTSPQTAGTSFSLHLAAFGTTPTDSQCGVIETYTGSQSVKFWSTYANPATGTIAATIGGTAIGTTEATASTRTVTFSSGQAVVTGKYKDAGALQISMKDDSASHPDLPTGTRGTTGTVIFKPATFVLSSIQRTSDGFANPAAGSATGSVFIGAGRPFSAIVTARDSEGSATPNYGKETPAESARLSATVVLPAAGANPAVAGPTGFGAFASGAASGTDFSWPEVGIVTLAASVRDGSYLGAGDVTGTASVNVGRFVPDYFDVAANTPQFQTGCSAGAFTYIGQPFTFSVAPVLTATARAFGGAATTNYAGAFWKLTNASLTGRTYSAGAVALDPSGLPATTVDPVIAPGTGSGTLTFSAGAGLALLRSTPVAPVNPQISLSLNVLDTDGVAASANPVTVGSPGGIAFSDSAEQRYGRLAFRNAAAPEVFPLPVPLTAQYYASSTAGFVAHTADACTTGVSLQLGAYAGNLGAGETCVVDTGAPGNSGAGCAAPGTIAQRYAAPPSAGNFNLHLAPPGAGNDGAVGITAVSPAWLRFDWDAGSPGLENAIGTARFGVYKGRGRLIYQRETF